MLGAAINLEILESHALEFIGKRFNSLRQKALACLAALSHHTRDTLVGIRLQIEKREVLELPLNGTHTQAVSQRRIDIHGLARLKEAAIFAQRCKRTHVMQAVGQLNDDDADVARHSKKHLAQVERLLLVHAVDFDVSELSYAVYEVGYRLTKDCRDIGKRGLGVLDRVMQKRRAHHIRVEIEFSQNNCHFDRMVDVHLARTTLLLGMLLCRKAVGTLNLSAIFFAHVLTTQASELVVVVSHNLIRQVIGMSNMKQLRCGAQRTFLVGMYRTRGLLRRIGV